MTNPDVFIIESLRFDDEKANRFEGKMISQILTLNEKKSEYYYIRTKRELEEVIDIFDDSEYRYLHLSCHGSPNSMETTLDSISFKELSEILNPVMKDRRLFISACEMVNDDLAGFIMPNTGCYSVIGPAEPIAFSDAAIIWSSFYHLAFSRSNNNMRRIDIAPHLKNLTKLFGVSMNYYSFVRKKPDEWKLTEYKIP